MLRQWRLVVIAQEFEFLFTVVEDFEKEHPAKLFEALGIAVGAGVLAHDVLDGFDEVGNVGHGSRCFLVQLGFEFTDRGKVVIPAAERFDDFNRRAEGGERIDFQDFQRLDAPEATIRILL